MSRYKTVYSEVEVQVDISKFDTYDLIEELESRGELPVDADHDAKELLRTIWQKRRVGNSNYQLELDQLIYHVLGYVV